MAVPTFDYGTAHLYGIGGTVTNATVQDFSLDDDFANRDKTEDENGNVVERRMDDETFTGKITIKILSTYSLPAVGTQLTYQAVIYEITKVGRVEKNKGFRMVTLDILTSEYVTL
ncbi:MAG: hypothetical protein ABSE62_05080 [Chthoniobacteraceae bacterium]|jgi:hypothetical protein